MRTLSIVTVLLVAGCPDRSRQQIEESIARMDGYATRVCACTDKACVDTVQNEMSAWSTEMAAKANSKSPRATDDQVKRMTAIGERYGACMTRVMTDHAEKHAAKQAALPGPDEPIIGAEATADTGIPECDEYRNAIMVFVTCDALPLESRKLIIESFEQAAGAWAHLSSEGKQAAATACKAATDAVKQAAVACK